MAPRPHRDPHRRSGCRVDAPLRPVQLRDPQEAQRRRDLPQHRRGSGTELQWCRPRAPEPHGRRAHLARAGCRSPHHVPPRDSVCRGLLLDYHVGHPSPA
ncbi:hypothetical protein ACFPRL_23675 [Pseudoclavibacter helvolus]